jgi:glycosyltransferase involved in cell wall biosynthesis
MAAKLGSEAIEFLGYVEPSEPLYHAWDICVSTSAYETFGMTVLESLACRCPVVAYPGGSIQEISGPGAKIVADGDEGQLYEAVRYLCENQLARCDMGEAGRRHGEREYDIRKTVSALATEYRAVIDAVN